MLDRLKQRIGAELLTYLERKRDHDIEESAPPPPPSPYVELHSPEALATKPFYNFGAGNWRHPYWTNVDYHSDYYAYRSELIDIAWDITSGAPVAIADASAEMVYCSHTVEHLADAHVDHMLAEAHRILKPGGIIRTTTPNAEQYFWAYRRRDRHFNLHYGHAFPFGDPRTYSVPGMSTWLVNEVATQLVQGVGAERRGAVFADKPAEIDQLIAETGGFEDVMTMLCGMVDFELQREVPGQHVNWWTADKMRQAYQRAGFAHSIATPAGGSIAAEMRDREHFDLVDPTFSIFVDAIKA